MGRIVTSDWQRLQNMAVLIASPALRLGQFMRLYSNDYTPTDVMVRADFTLINAVGWEYTPAGEPTYSGGAGAAEVGLWWFLGPTGPRFRSFQLPVVRWFVDSSPVVPITAYGWLMITTSLTSGGNVFSAGRFPEPVVFASGGDEVLVSHEIDVTSRWQTAG